MAWLERRENGKTRVRWVDSRGSVKGRTAPTKAVAKRLALEVEAARALGRDWQPESAAPRPRLALVMVSYIEHRERTKAQKTVGDDIAQLDLFVRWASAKLGREAELGDLSRALLEDYDRHLSTIGHRTVLGPGSRRQVLGQILRFWAWAYDSDQWEALTPKPRKIAMPAAVKSRVHAPTWAQMDLVIGRCSDELVRRAAVLLRCLGWRISQVCRLVTEDLDLRGGLVTLRPELGKSVHERAGRVLPMPVELRLEVATWRLRPGERVVPRAIGSVRRALRKAWARAELPAVLWHRRPDHAFRKGLRTELLASRKVESQAIEYWCGRHEGVSADYTDPRCLALEEIARTIPQLARDAQGAPLMRLLYSAEPVTSG